MLKDYLKTHGISTYSLAKKSGVPYSTLNDLVNQKVRIGKCNAEMLKALSVALDISMDELYDISVVPSITVKNDYGVSCLVEVKSKQYHVSFEYEGDPVDLTLCKVNDNTSYYINEIAKWKSEDYIRELRMKAFEEGRDL